MLGGNRGGPPLLLLPLPLLVVPTTNPIPREPLYPSRPSSRWTQQAESLASLTSMVGPALQGAVGDSANNNNALANIMGMIGPALNALQNNPRTSSASPPSCSCSYCCPDSSTRSGSSLPCSPTCLLLKRFHHRRNSYPRTN